MELWEAIRLRRSVRAFAQDELDQAVLSEMIEAARLAPAAANLQPLEYLVVTQPELREQVFACLKWAAYIAPKGNPPEGKRPTAYVAVLARQDYLPPVGSDYDVGAAVMSMLLAGVARGVAGCWIKSVNTPKLREVLALPEGLALDSVVALGRPAESPAQVDLAPEQEGREAIRYWRDETGQHFVPKRARAAILRWQRYGG